MKIKINIATLFIALIAFSFSACTEWLDVVPEGFPNEGTSWKTDNDYEKAVIAIYGCFSKEETWGRDLFWEQGASDDIFFSRARGASQMNLATLEMDGITEGSIKSIYKEFYRTMAGANSIIEHAVLMDSRSATINRCLGEAYFMRAFTHFMIAYRYGRVDNGVPFIRYEDGEGLDTEIPPQMATVMENYKLIIEDLQKAAELLPWFKEYGRDNWGRATKDAAYGFMVKTYGYWAQHDASQWNNIPALVDQIEAGGSRALLDSFADVFLIDNNWSAEHIWSVNSSGSQIAGSIFPGIMLDNKGWGRYNGWGNFKPTLELVAEFDEGDERFAATIMQYGDPFVFFGEERRFYSTADLECGFHFRKYMDPFSYGTFDAQSGAGISDRISPNGDRPTTDLNVPILRFAELLLWKAEALIETGKGADAAKVLNRITTRAGLGNKYSNATITDLMHERRCELAGEYTDRVHDLKRWAPKYPIAKQKLEAAKHGLKYLDRGDPDSQLDLSNSSSMTINGKTYQGVIEIMAAKTYNADKDCVLPYEVNEVIKARGALKQNAGYNSN